MSEEKKSDPVWNEIPTHPSQKSGRIPTDRPAWMEEKPEPEPPPPPPPQPTKFSPEEQEAWAEATKIPEELAKDLTDFLIMIDNMKKDPQALAELESLLLKEFPGEK
jgi:hypothetical protein